MAETRTSAGSSDTGAYPAPAASVARLFYDRVQATPDAEAFRFPARGGWESVTWAQAEHTIRAVAAGLLALGVDTEDRVAIVSNTRIEWVYADLAIMCAGGATTTVYPTTAENGVAYILADSDSRIVFAEDDLQLEKLRHLRGQLPRMTHVITFDHTTDDTTDRTADDATDDAWLLSLEDLIALGAAHLAEHPSAVDDCVAGVRPEQLATLLYTSGTTGPPKGVELPHRCWTYIGAGATTLHLVSASDLQLLWLPLAHAFGKMLEAVQLQVGFPTAVDGRIDRLADNLTAIRPTFVAGPPRIFEKIHSTVVQTVEEQGGLRQRLFRWAFAVGEDAGRARIENRRLGPLAQARFRVADRLVLSQIRDRLGGRIRFLVSGSAPLSADVARWFYAAGVPIVEGYGLTETSAGVSVAVLDDLWFGAVGTPLAGTEVRLAPDGEIQVRGPGVMRGYHHQPEATASVLSHDGWFATGDIGEIDERGRLRVTDRKKDLIKTSGGKYIAPQPIEVSFKALCPLASEMIVHAEGRNYATALIALDTDALSQWGRARGLTATDYPALARHPTVRAYVGSCVELLNGRLNRWETIKDFRILDHDLSVEAEEMTPSMKPRRRVIEDRYKPLVDSMYDAARTSDSPRHSTT